MVSFLLWTLSVNESSIFAIAVHLERICFCSVLINMETSDILHLLFFLSWSWGSELVLEFLETLEAPPVEQHSQQLTLILSDVR